MRCIQDIAPPLGPLSWSPLLFDKKKKKKKKKKNSKDQGPTCDSALRRGIFSLPAAGMLGLKSRYWDPQLAIELKLLQLRGRGWRWYLEIVEIEKTRKHRRVDVDVCVRPGLISYHSSSNRLIHMHMYRNIVLNNVQL